MFETKGSCRGYENDEFIKDYVYPTPDGALFYRSPNTFDLLSAIHLTLSDMNAGHFYFPNASRAPFSGWGRGSKALLQFTFMGI